MEGKMDNQELRKSFTDNWNEFLAELRGSLVNYAEKHNLSSASASQILSDTLFQWKSDSNIIAKWLDKLKNDDYEKSIKVSNILFKEIKFEKVEMKPDKLVEILPFLPWGISFVAFGITWNYNLSIWIKIAAIILPPILLKPIIRKKKEELNRLAAKATIPEYISQLDKYKEAILAVL